MYKAIKDVGGYKIGDIVPDSKAKMWLAMYDVPHVEKVDENAVANEKSNKGSEEKESALDGILEDYLGRNQGVVKKNISEDKLSKSQLNELLKLEEADKRRPLVINAIKQRLKS